MIISRISSGVSRRVKAEFSNTKGDWEFVKRDLWHKRYRLVLLKGSLVLSMEVGPACAHAGHLVDCLVYETYKVLVRFRHQRLPLLHVH